MRHEIIVRNEGMKSQYYILRVYRNETDYPIVHTSKVLSYLTKLLKERYSK